MPVLSNAKHELFCQHLALGKTASEAYELAGYKPSRSNASVLRTKQSVSDRLSEILQQSERKVAFGRGREVTLGREVGQSR